MMPKVGQLTAISVTSHCLAKTTLCGAYRDLVTPPEGKIFALDLKHSHQKSITFALHSCDG
jgi:hypothetical protein